MSLRATPGSCRNTGSPRKRGSRSRAACALPLRHRGTNACRRCHRCRFHGDQHLLGGTRSESVGRYRFAPNAIASRGPERLLLLVRCGSVRLCRHTLATTPKQKPSTDSVGHSIRRHRARTTRQHRDGIVLAACPAVRAPANATPSAARHRGADTPNLSVRLRARTRTKDHQSRRSRPRLPVLRPRPPAR
jgi:hypothetical protein